jgi:ATP adenylyltransferase/5',5'''-P-1,P-4-tetraphosphate phosphorylase II
VKEFFGEGSDIRKSHPDQVLGNLSDTHILALNIFPSSRPHYLLLTMNPRRRQDEVLDSQDIKFAWTLLHSVNNDGDYYVMYNCGPESGCSREHKHMQASKRPGAEGTEAGETGFRFFPDVDGDEARAKVPYKYFLHLFAKPGMKHNTADDVYEVYRDLLHKCRSALGSVHCPHNLILTREWLLVIPRRYPENGKYMELLPNGAGMMGMVTAAEQEKIDEWMSEGPATVLGAFGLPPDSET